MVTAPALPQVIDKNPYDVLARTRFEARLHSTLEGAFQALRERLLACIAAEGSLPIVFWLRERDSLVQILIPVYHEGLLLGVEAARAQISRDREPKFINPNARFQDMVLHLTRELAQDVTVKAARSLEAALSEERDLPMTLDTLRQHLIFGPLSDACAQQLASSETPRLSAAGQLFVQRGAIPGGKGS